MRDEIADLFNRWKQFYGLVHRKSIKFTKPEDHDSLLLKTLHGGDCGITVFAVASILEQRYGPKFTFYDNGEHAYFSIVLLNSGAVEDNYVKYYFDAAHPHGVPDPSVLFGAPEDLRKVESGKHLGFIREKFMPVDSLGYAYVKGFFQIVTGKSFDVAYPEFKQHLDFDYFDVYGAEL